MKGLLDFLLDITAAGLALSSAFLAFALSFMDAAIPAIADAPWPLPVSTNAGLVVAIGLSAFRTRRERAARQVVRSMP